MKIQWMLLPVLLFMYVGCDQQEVAVVENPPANSNDSAMVEESPSETLTVNAEEGKQQGSNQTIDARVALKDSIAMAKNQDKNVFVHYGSPG